MENLETKELASVLEGILFASGEPVDVGRLAFALELDRETTEQLLQHLRRIITPMSGAECG